jgi:hypothetical protein
VPEPIGLLCTVRILALALDAPKTPPARTRQINTANAALLFFSIVTFEYRLIIANLPSEIMQIPALLRKGPNGLDSGGGSMPCRRKL